MRITDLWTDQPQYLPHAPVGLVAQREGENEACQLSVRLRIARLGGWLCTREETLRFEAGVAQSQPLVIGGFAEKSAGFGVELEALGDTLYTAFDVAEDSRRMPRYGFLCRFDGADASEAPVEDLLKNHITWVQFYDWMYRHEELLPPQHAFTDLMGRSMDIRCVKRRIDQCHRHGLSPIAYGAIYAASYPFAKNHPDWLLYGGNGKPLDFIGLLRYMNIAPGAPWREHIQRQYALAMERLGFSGIHMDTYGYPKDALASDGTVVRLAECFPSLIDETRCGIREKTACEPLLVFNNVGNWPVDTVARAAQDALYIEVWPPYERYAHLRDISLSAQALQSGKPVILAAYAKAFMGYPKEEAWHSAFLLQGVMAACGVHGLLLGESGGVLTQAYYADYYREEDPAWLMRQRRYSDFVVRWSELLYAEKRRDVSMTHTLGDNREYLFSGVPISAELKGGCVGVIINALPGVKVVHLFDLRASDDLWQTGKRPAPDEYELTLEALLLHAPRTIYAASPEREGGRANALPYRVLEKESDLYVQTSIRSAQPWTMLVIEETGG